MKTFRDIAESYQEAIDEVAKFTKKKTFASDGKGNLKKKIKKFCADIDGNKVEGFKLVGKKCIKMKGSEIKDKKKSAKKAVKTKAKHSSKIEREALKLRAKKIQKGLIKDPSDNDD